MSLINIVDRRKHWWKVFASICILSVAVVGYVGVKTYTYAPPICDFVDAEGGVVFSAADITAGQLVFFNRGLMEYGTFLGDGALRGPDFTAEALHRTALSMHRHHDAAWSGRIPDEATRRTVVQSLVQRELKENRHRDGVVVLTAAQIQAFQELVAYYGEKFGAGGPLAGPEAFTPANYVTDPAKVRQLTAFFFWGGWLCAAERPGQPYSYTHNWPFDPLAGNLPHGGLVMWSIIGTLVVILSIGVMFYYYGKADREAVLEEQRTRMPPLATMRQVDGFKPMPSQRATYKYFAVAALLFGLQVLAGLLAIGDYVGLDLRGWLPVTVTRAWHTQISILWISVCWFAATIWVLPLICRPEPRGQLRWINGLFWLLVVTAVGSTVGIPLGIHGMFSDAVNRWLGLQGWEFLQLGRVYQYLLYAAFVIWAVIIIRGVWPILRQRQTWSLPNWMVYMSGGIIFMFTASFVADPDTNFVIADFWRWCMIHMWVEAFFEVFTTVLVAYFLYLMGFVSHLMAARVVYLSSVLFLGSGLIGISHNFYWNAKSIETVALGGVLSSLQVAPLVLLTVEAWRFRQLPRSTVQELRAGPGGDATFGLGEAFLFLVGVNFWNFVGAGVLGFMINLPIVNYYQHGTYLTVNHGHAALMGVYGNLAIAAMLFCARWNLTAARWNAPLLRTVFWSLNVGLALMVGLDLFPVGLHQLAAVMSEGYAFARSQAYMQGSVFQSLTWLRGIGITVFVLGGVLPLIWFMVTRWRNQKEAQSPVEQFVVPPTVLAATPAAAAALSNATASGVR